MTYLDGEDREILKDVLVAWYGPQASQWQINDGVAELVLKLVAEMQSCTSVMAYVPLPVNFGNALAQLGKDALKKLLRQLKNNTGVYKSCGGRVIINFKSEISLAGMGF
jgi:hypothetical protein